MLKISSIFRRRQATDPDVPSKEPMIAVAPDKFKGTLTAAEVTDMIADAAVAAFPKAMVVRAPMADGGEGTAGIIARRLNLSPASVAGHDAMMHDIEIDYFSDGSICAVDAASIIGLAMLDRHNLHPWEASSYGVGEFIAEMLRQGMKQIIICIGGTATIDAGAGMLQALGARFLDVEGEPIDVCPMTASQLSAIYSVDFSGIDRHTVKERVKALADVDVPLVPEAEGDMSALDFAMQKGVEEDSLPLLRASFDNFRHAVDNALYPAAAEPPFQGAGGGLGYALHRVLRCECAKGADFVLGGYQISTLRPDCIVTGEGCFDTQSLTGKVTGTIIDMARTYGIPVIIVAGISSIDYSQLPSSVKIITTAEYLPTAGTKNAASTKKSSSTATHEPASHVDNLILTHQTAAEALKTALPPIIQAIKHSASGS